MILQDRSALDLRKPLPNEIRMPDGQIHWNGLTARDLTVHEWIVASLHSYEQLFRLALVLDHSACNGEHKVLITYLHGARSDRMFTPEQPQVLPTVLKFLAPYITAGNAFFVYEPHSAATTSYTGIQRVSAMFEQQLAIKAFHPTHIVFPDKGAQVRYHSHSLFGLPVVTALKERDPDTGELQFNGFDHELCTSDRPLIIDDLCDGGATFTNLALHLPQIPKTQLGLFVAHGIFSKGLPDGFLADNIFTTDSYPSHWKPPTQNIFPLTQP